MYIHSRKEGNLPSVPRNTTKINKMNAWECKETVNEDFNSLKCF